MGDYPKLWGSGLHNAITWVLARKRQAGRSSQKRSYDDRSREILKDATLLALKWRMGPGVKECRGILETRTDEETDSFLDFRKNTADTLILGLRSSRNVR